MDILRNKQVAILGYGKEGKSTAAYAHKLGAEPVIFDHRELSAFTPEEQLEIKQSGYNFILGKDALKELAGFTLAFRAPGLWRFHSDLIDAEKKGVEVTSQTKWFFKYSPAKIIGVTGTKGKGTTASLVYAMLQRAKQNNELGAKTNIYISGNIGKSDPLELLGTLTEHDLVVYELSSFQLQDLTQSPYIGICLMVTEDHLDVHASAEEYISAKGAITKFQTQEDYSIYNDDYGASSSIGKMGNGIKLAISENHPPSVGAYIDGGSVHITLPEGTLYTVDARNRKIRGQHNMQNIAAAVTASLLLGAKTQTLEQTIAEFPGLEHRLQLVADREGILFFSDSFATVPQSTEVAVKAFTEPLILILGGSSKDASFDSLAKTIAATQNIKALILIGQETGRIRSALMRFGFIGSILQGAKNMQEIFEQIFHVANKGDVVLLSPACASFDMFKNYIDRGEQFTALAKEWKRNDKGSDKN